MDKFLRLLEKPQPEVTIDKEKLNYFISEVSIYDYFSISEQSCKSSRVQAKNKLV